MDEVGGGVFWEVFGTGIKTYFDFVFITYPVVFDGFPFLPLLPNMIINPNRSNLENFK